MFRVVFGRFIRMLGRAWFLILFLTTVLCTLFFIYSPMIGDQDFRPFDDLLPRLIVVTIIALLGLLLILTIYMMRARRDKALVNDIAASSDSTAPEDEAVKAELADMRDKLKNALVKLRKSKLGRKSLYELPWYIMIGPPGAGKTTAIENSGLNFPLADEIGKGGLGGVGGTRNCDWLFTENAVLIDTAGRYTTQESDAEADNAGWLGFLNLLKKHRPRQPINGAMVAISLSDLSLQDEQTQLAHARAVRRRLHELREKLGVRFPVYVVFTKADLIAGFVEYFDDLGKEERGQVWGFTLPLDKSKGEKSPVAAFDDEFAALLGRLNAQLLERLQRETDHQRRSLVQGFPGQVASVRDLAKRFLAEVFVDNRYEHRHMLRGVYFTSGVQEGTPIDRLMMGMAKTFGLGRQAVGAGQGQARSFFLTRLFEGVIFPEAGLVSADDKVEKRYRWSVRGALAATVVFALLAGGFWAQSFLGNRALLADSAAQIQNFRAQLAGVPPSPVGDTDLPGVIPALNALRDMPLNPVTARLNNRLKIEAPPSPHDEATLGFGLYQGDRLSNEVGIAYRDALNRLLLPRLLLRLEEQIQASLDEPETLYETLKVYLILGSQGPMNRDLVMQYMVHDWELSYPRDARLPEREDLAYHLDAMLLGPLDKIPLNGDLIARAQENLADLSPAERAYKGIVASAVVKGLPEFRLSVAGGNAIGRVMMRASGKPLSEGIPGIYTYKGFNEVFIIEVAKVADRVQEDAFVLGGFGKKIDTDELIVLARDVLNLYYVDFIAHYETLLGDLNLVPMADLTQAAERASVLAGPGSPMQEVLVAISNETKLTAKPAVALDTTEVAGGLGQVIRREFVESLSVTSLRVLRALESATADGLPQKPPGLEVEERFAPIHALVDASGGPSQVDDLRAQLQLVARELNQNRGRERLITDLPELRLYTEMAKAHGDPLARWASQLLSGAAGVAAVSGREGINRVWQSEVLPSCKAALDLYPFNRRSASEIGLRDFGDLFGNDGKFDKFFKEHLVQIVDTTQRPWVFREVNGEDLGIPNEVLQVFERAAEIRAAFFGSGQKIEVRFQITPFALAPEAHSAVLEVDGNTVVFTQRDAQPRPVGLIWPGQFGIGRVSLQPELSGRQNQLNFEGFWAFFRLLQAAEIRETADAGRRRLNFPIGGRLASFTMQIDGTNVFSLAAMSNFTCPESF